MTLHDERATRTASVPPRDELNADGPTPVRRDASIDVARAWCLVVVVVLHACMVGVSVGPDGAPVIENAMEGWGGFAAATWLVQVMPLFFVLGGASAFLDRSRVRAGAGGAAAYAADRVRRLVVPALAAGLATVAVLACLAFGGVAPDVVAEAGFRLSQPLWFLGVYVLCSAIVPLAVACHHRRPAVAPVVLAAIVVAVDLVRRGTGIDAIGFANLLFVWVLVQQLGFFVGDGTTSRVPRPLLLPLACAALLAAASLCSLGAAPFDLLAALNPPSPVLVLIGIAQLLLFESARPLLRRLAARRPVGVAVTAITRRAMTIYSWHMLALIGLAGALLAVGAPLPVPLSGAWWATRPLWLIAVAVLVAALSALVGGLERGRVRLDPRATTTPRAAAAVACAASGALTVLIGTGSTLAWTVGTILWCTALVLAGAPIGRTGGRSRAAGASGLRSPVGPVGGASS